MLVVICYWVACVDGMPVYEGSTKVWENYKAQLEQEMEMQATPISVVNPVEHLNELFPEVEFEFPDSNEKSGGFFRAQYKIAGNVYEGVGLNKRDAKANAAANTIEALEKSGQLAQRQSEIEAKRKERQEKQTKTEKSETSKGKPVLEKSDNVRLAQSPTMKLQEIYPQAEFHILGETPLRNTAIRAFIAAAVVDDQTFVGVGRSKKLAKTAAAEKALRALGYWTEEDDSAKKHRQKDTKSDFVPPLMAIERFAPLLHDDGIPSLVGASHYGWSARGRSCWGFGSGSRGYQQRGRGRGFAAGYNEYDWFGGAVGDTLGAESDMMIVELSNLVGRILETNPNMGVSDVWNLLQQNPQYQSWRSGTFGPNMSSYYLDYGDSYSEEYYGAFADPSSGYSGDGYYYPPETYPTAGVRRGQGVNIRSWSRDPAATGRRGGKNKFQSSASYW